MITFSFIKVEDCEPGNILITINSSSYIIITAKNYK